MMLVYLDWKGLTAVGIFIVPIGSCRKDQRSGSDGWKYLPNRVGLAAGMPLGPSMTIGELMMPLFGSIADDYGLRMTIFLLALAAACGSSLMLHEPRMRAPEAV
jgi:hypothetical protein